MATRKTRTWDEPIDRTEYVAELYSKYGTDLKAAREILRALYPKLGTPMFDDVEGEILYMLIRDKQPQTVVEISSGCGWSSSWILSALRDNHRGTLTACEQFDEAVVKIPYEIHDARYTLHVGDIRDLVYLFPDHADFMLVDSAHDETFNEWFAETFFDRADVLCVHDVFMAQHSRHSDATVLFDYAKLIGKRFWTPATCFPETYTQIEQARHAAGIDDFIHYYKSNPLAILEK